MEKREVLILVSPVDLPDLDDRYNCRRDRGPRRLRGWWLGHSRRPTSRGVFPLGRETPKPERVVLRKPLRRHFPPESRTCRPYVPTQSLPVLRTLVETGTSGVSLRRRCPLELSPVSRALGPGLTPTRVLGTTRVVEGPSSGVRAPRASRGTR